MTAAFPAATSIASVAVTVDGDALDPAIVSAITGVRIAERLSCPAQCEVRLVGAELAAAFAIGDEITVGLTTDDQAAFTGEITAISHDFSADAMAEVRIRAYDRLHRLRKRQSVRSFADTDLGVVAGEIVGDLGLSVDLGADVPRWPQLVQHRQTDFELFVDAARRAGLWFVLHDDTLRFVTLAGSDDPIELRYGADLLEITVEQNSASAYHAVTALGWDLGDAIALRGEGTTSNVAYDAPADTAPGSWDVDGSRVLVDALGTSGDALAALARAELDVQAASELTVVGTAAGAARLRAGALITVTGLGGDRSNPSNGDSGGGAELRGPHLLTEVVHTLDLLGYLTWFSSRPPTLEPVGAAASVSLGVVTATDDPDHHGRVQVRFPGIGDIGSLWLPVVSPAAGSGKGLVALPDVDDTVVILFPHLDPANGIVIGGLFGGEGPFDDGVVGRDVQRYTLATRGGQSIVLDDDKHRVVLRDDTGNLVELGPDRVRLHAEVDLVIDAPGRNVTVRAKRIDFEEAAEPEDPPAGRGPTPKGPGATASAPAAGRGGDA